LCEENKKLPGYNSKVLAHATLKLRRIGALSIRKLELNLKKSNLSDAVKFSSVFSFLFFTLKVRLNELKFEFYQIKIGYNHG